VENATDWQTPRSLRGSFLAAAWFVGVLWLIRIADSLAALNLARFGVFPREPWGLTGILTGPLIHGSFTHLFANTLPLIVLGTSVIYGYPRAARFALPLIYLGSGLGVWLFARPSFHIGASGLAYGMMFFVFVIGVLRRDKPAIALSLLVFFLYGGMIHGILPQRPDISFEAHLFGALTGVGCAFLLRHSDPTPPRKEYDWEGETGLDPADEGPTDEQRAPSSGPTTDEPVNRD
jgi:membrane associated rhomboid family serine protease